VEERVQQTTEVPAGHTDRPSGKKSRAPGQNYDGIRRARGRRRRHRTDSKSCGRRERERERERGGEGGRKRERERKEEKREIERERKRKRERRWTRHGALSSVRTRASKPVPLGESRAHKVEDRREEP